MGDRDKRLELWNGVLVGGWDVECCCPLCISLHVRTSPHPSAYRYADNRGRLTAERLQAVPCTCGRAAEWMFFSAPLPAHIAERAVAATKVRPPRAASLVGVPEAGTQHLAAARARAMVAPSAAEQAMSAMLRVELEHVLAGQGSRATREHRERRIRGGNHRGAERRRLPGQTMPQPGAAASPMLCEDRDSGVAPWKWPRQDRSEAPGRRRQVAVATAASPLPRAPASAQSSAPTNGSVWAVGGRGYTADSSSLSDDWSALLSLAIKLLTYVFAD